MADPLPWLGGGTTLGLGLLGWWATHRRDKTDAGSTLVQMGLDIATRADTERHECADELERVRAQLVAVTARLDAHAEAIRKCEGDRELLLAIATKAGLDVRDIE